VVTPRTTRLIRAADLRAFHRAIIGCLPVEPVASRACAVIVPSRSAAEELRRTIENVTVLPPDRLRHGCGESAEDGRRKLQK
jgi:hypothetical protein